MAATNIKARRKLSDLYKRGVEVRFRAGEEEGRPVGKIGPFVDTDGQPIPPTDDDVTLWVQPPSPLQREMALRDAQASRSKALVRAKGDKDSEEHLTVMAFLVDMNDGEIVDYVLSQDVESRRREAERDVLADKEWEDITSYQDALRTFEENETPEDDPEYAAMLELDKKFGTQVNERLKELTDSARSAMEIMGRERVQRKALDKRSDIVGSQAFMQEYERQMLFYALRDSDDTTQMFFESARELADAEDGFREVVQEALLPFISEGSEAKNSPGAESGSESSEPPSKPETSEASTPETATE